METPEAAWSSKAHHQPTTINGTFKEWSVSLPAANQHFSVTPASTPFSQKSDFTSSGSKKLSPTYIRHFKLISQTFLMKQFCESKTRRSMISRKIVFNE